MLSLSLERLEPRTMLCSPSTTVADLNAVLFGWQALDNPQSALQCVVDNWHAEPKQAATGSIQVDRKVVRSPPDGNIDPVYGSLTGLSIVLAEDYASNVLHLPRLGKEGAQPTRYYYAPGLGEDEVLGRWIQTEYWKFATKLSNRIANGPAGEGDGLYREYDSDQTPDLTGMISGALINGDHKTSVVITDVRFIASADPEDDQTMLQFNATWTWYDRFDMKPPNWSSTSEDIANEDSWFAKSLIAVGTAVEAGVYWVGDRLLQLDYPIELTWNERVEVTIE